MRDSDIVLVLQITSNGESLLRYCFRHGDRTSSFLGNSICLRLNNLSLSRMGSIEKLLWVQMLDLSHNELRSIEGKLLHYLIYFTGSLFSLFSSKYLLISCLTHQLN